MRNVADGVNFSLSSLENFQDRALAERVISTILAGPGFAVPTRYGQNQPLTRRINPSSIDPLIDLWIPKPIASAAEFLTLRKAFC